MDDTLPGGGTVVGDVVLVDEHPAAFAVGACIADRYTIVRFLGRGGMGEVYEAEDAELHTSVAIKVIRAERLHDARTVALLKREIATARRVTHPNVCRVFDVEYHRETAFYTMELLRGESLADRISRRGVLGTDEALPIVEQLCEGLAAAHDAGIVHRDFKPHNVMLVPRDGGGERAVITDFGLAVAMESGDPTRSMELMGTPAYMAPEQLDGSAMTRAVDVYALGVTLFEMVTGKLPFSASTPLATALARVQRDAPTARSLVRDLDARWDAAIRRCLARDPDDRFAAVGDVVAALRGAPPRSRRAWIAGGLAAVTVIGAAVAVVATRDAPSRPAPPAVFFESATGPVQRALTIGGIASEKIEDAYEDADGNLVVVGHFSSGFRLGDRVVPAPPSGSTTTLAASIAPDGTVRWLRTFPSSAKGRFRSVVALADGTLVVAGAFQRGTIDLAEGGRHETTGANAALVIALSPNDGSIRWSRVLRAEAGSVDVRIVAVGPDGNLYLGADLGGALDLDGTHLDGGRASPLVFSLTPAGAARWAHVGSGGTNTRVWDLAFRGDDLLVAGSAAGDVRFAGIAWHNASNRQPFVAAFRRDNGEVRWGRAFTAGYGEAKTLAVSPAGRIVVGGGFGARIEPAPGIVWEIDPLKPGAWLVELDPETGETAWIVPVAEANEPRTVSQAVFLDEDRLLVVGAYYGTLAIAGTTLRAVHESDQYLAVVGNRGVALAAASFGGIDNEPTRRLWLRPDGTVAMVGRHRGMDIGGVHLPSGGLDDGFYLELRLEELLGPGARPPPSPVEESLIFGGLGKGALEASLRDRDGNLYLAGHARSRFEVAGTSMEPLQRGQSMAYVIKLGPDGRMLWHRVFAGDTSPIITQIALGPEGVYAVGLFLHGEQDFGGGRLRARDVNDGFVVALDPQGGETRWVRGLGATRRAHARSVAVDTHGNVVVAGEVDGSPILASYTPDGARRWIRAGSGGTASRAFAVLVDGERIYLGAQGAGAIQFAGARWDTHEQAAFLGAFDAETGATLWSQAVGIGATLVTGMAIDGDRLACTGFFADELRLGDHTIRATGPAERESWVAELDAGSGEARWLTYLGGNTADMRQPAYLPDGRLLVAGEIGGAVTIAGVRLAPEDGSDLLLVTYDRTGTPTNAAIHRMPGTIRARRLALGADDRVILNGKLADPERPEGGSYRLVLRLDVLFQ